MTSGDVYRAAAESIAAGSENLCCFAIPRVKDLPIDSADPDIVAFRTLFAPDYPGTLWWPAGDYDTRIVALCLMAAIADAPK